MYGSKDDLMKELEDLEQEALEEKLLDVGPIADKLPSVPSAQPTPAARGNDNLQLLKYFTTLCLLKTAMQPASKKLLADQSLSVELLCVE